MKKENVAPKRNKKAGSQQLYRFALVCEKDGEIVHADGVGATFKCPTCGLTMHWNKTKRELLAHGKEERTIKHKMRAAQEL